jgi:ferredoxin-fold anticodon binding domain-containing protein
MQIVKIGDCQVRKNPNFEKMNEGKEYVSVVFKTDEDNRILVDLVYTMDGMLRIHVLPILSNNEKSYDKIIEIKLSDGKTILDKLSVHN